MLRIYKALMAFGQRSSCCFQAKRIWDVSFSMCTKFGRLPSLLTAFLAPWKRVTLGCDCFESSTLQRFGHVHVCACVCVCVCQCVWCLLAVCYALKWDFSGLHATQVLPEGYCTVLVGRCTVQYTR